MLLTSEYTRMRWWVCMQLPAVRVFEFLSTRILCPKSTSQSKLYRILALCSMRVVVDSRIQLGLHTLRVLWWTYKVYAFVVHSNSPPHISWSFGHGSILFPFDSYNSVLLSSRLLVHITPVLFFSPLTMSPKGTSTFLMLHICFRILLIKNS